MKFIKIAILTVIFCPLISHAVGSTGYGKIVGIESRAWGMHIQTDFGYVPSTNSGLNCSATVGNTYMYDFRYDSIRNGPGEGKVGASMILAAFLSQKEISFHLYECHNGGERPLVGYIRLK